MASKISQKVGPRGEKSSSESHLAIFSCFPNTRLSLSCKKQFWDENSPRISHKPWPLLFFKNGAKPQQKKEIFHRHKNKQQNQKQKKTPLFPRRVQHEKPSTVVATLLRHSQGPEWRSSSYHTAWMDGYWQDRELFLFIGSPSLSLSPQTPTPPPPQLGLKWSFLKTCGCGFFNLPLRYGVFFFYLWLGFKTLSYGKIFCPFVNSLPMVKYLAHLFSFFCVW